MFDFTDKSVLITGAAQGFGRVCAVAFAKAGARLALCDINDSGGAATLAQVEAIGAKGIYVHADVSVESEVEAFVAATVKAFGRLDIAVNNAAQECPGPTLELPSADFDRLIDVNLKGVYYGMRHQVPAMKLGGGGAIVNQASVTSSMTGVADNGLYAATKGGVIALTKSVALEVAADNISVNALATAGFDIPDDVFLRWLETYKTSIDAASKWFPVQRLGRPEEIAAAVMYLASDEARFCTGSVLTLDGGFTAA